MKRWNLVIGKEKKIKVLCTLLAVTLAFSAAGCGAAGEAGAVSEAGDGILRTAMTGELPSHSSTDGKEETVYVIADARGKNGKVIVSDWLRNPGGQPSLEDRTELRDITNVNGYGDYTENGDGTITWDTEHADVYYQGTTDKELPVEVKLRYYLDGEEIAPEELAGKSGHVRIRFDYVNHAKTEVVIGGKREEIALPFAMLSGLVLPASHFSNIRVTNGKVMSEGENSIVVGMALPGLRESLDWEDMRAGVQDAEARKKLDEIHIPEYVEVEADAEDFALDMTLTMATTDYLSGMDFGDALDAGKLTDQMEELQSGIDRLTEGGASLSEGSTELASGAAELTDGGSKLTDGTGSLLDGAKRLADGTDRLSDGMQQLGNGAGELASGASDLTDGVGRLSSGAASLRDGTGKLQSGAAELAGGTDRLSAGASALAEGSGTLAAKSKELDAGAENLRDGAARLSAGTQSMMKQLPVFQSGIGQLAAGAAALDDAVNGTGGGAAMNLSEAAQALSSGLDSDGSGSSGMGLKQGLTAAASGAAQLQSASEQLCTLLAQEESGRKSLADSRDAMQKMISAALSRARDEHSAAQSAVTAGEERVKQARAAVSAAAEPVESESTETGEVPESPEIFIDETAEHSEAAERSGEEADSGTQAGAAAQAGSGSSADSAAQADSGTRTGENAGIGEGAGAEDNMESGGSAGAGSSTAPAAAVIKRYARTVDTKALDAALAEYESAVQALAGAQADEEAASALVSQLEQLQEQLSSAGTLPENPGAGAASAYGLAQQTAGGMKSLAQKLSAMESGADQLSAGAAALNRAVNGGGSGQSLCEAAAALHTGAAALEQGGGVLASGASQLLDGTSQLSEGSARLKAGTSALSDGAVQLDRGVNEVKNGSLQLKNGASELRGGASQAADGAGKLADGASELCSGADRLSSGAAELAGGVTPLLDGTETLQDGAYSLRDGAATLDAGAKTLLEGIERLSAGAQGLDDGTKTLLDGLRRYNEEGIRRVTELFGDEAAAVLERWEAVSDAGKEYTSFTGAIPRRDEDGVSENSVKFVYRTAAVGKDGE
ncbi:hypothetical protein [Lachnoclostridium sp. Marseille-P6806]|uniref:hypothetical protein n=1 Tax=Lachnoclostridium sp. Marseille-P6806 TaxID=2364793 RepID=UPI0013EF04A0|nr:hypothetical protein [Lachnoclostridium sp. Marseille-P6806]